MTELSLSAPPTAAEIAARVRSGAATARQQVDESLARISERDAAVGAFQVVRAEAARREAEIVDARADRADLPLAGVPIAVKDNLSVAGEPMRSGTDATPTDPQVADHEVVRRVRAAGAIVVGLTRMPELGVFGATDSVFGVTRNPWDATRTPGGSSGGSAAAVAAGMVAAALGNDGLGSIRIPAACCGLVGVKPGFGVVPAELGVGSWFDMAENGPLTTTVADAALLLSVLAGRPDLAVVADPGRVRVAVSLRSPIVGVTVDRSWKDAARVAGELLRRRGHTVRQATPPYDSRTGAAGMARWFAAAEIDARAVADRRRLAPRTRTHTAIGRAVLRAGRPTPAGRTRWQAGAERFFADHDVLVTPALARSPIAATEWWRRSWAANVAANVRYAPMAAPWNLAGWPALVVPTGVGPDGMPRAAQLVARPGGEAVLLGLAAQLEAARPWQRTAVLD